MTRVIATEPSAQARFVFGSLACPVCPYGVSERCEGESTATAESFTMHDSSVIGCVDPARQRTYFADLRSRAGFVRPRSRHSEISLPAFIPQVCTGLGRTLTSKGDPLFCVSLSTILDDEGRVKYNSGATLRRTLKLPVNSRLALIGTARDSTIERFWTDSKSGRAWKKIADLGFEFSTSFTYSVWDRHPRFDQIFNQERNFASYNILLEQGVISIPFLFFYNERDYREILVWLNSHRDVRKIAILTQFQKAEANFSRVIKDMHRLEADVSRQIHFLVIGPSSASRIKKLLENFSSVTIVTSQPIVKATRNERTLSNLRHVRADIRIPKVDLAASNLNMYRRFFSVMRKANRVPRDRSQRFAPLLNGIRVN